MQFKTIYNYTIYLNEYMNTYSFGKYPFIFKLLDLGFIIYN